MSHFPDTSFLYALYRMQSNSPKADACMDSLPGALPVSSLLLFEFRQSVRLQIRLHRHDKSKGFGQREGEQMLRDLQADLASGVMARIPVDWEDAHGLAEGLSSKHTITEGCRFADILHVATALHLGAAEFLSFDENQKKLAKAAGLQVPL